MSERRWRVTGRCRGLFVIEVDNGDGFRAATAAEVDAALRPRELCSGRRITRCSASTRPNARVTTSMSVDGSRTWWR